MKPTDAIRELKKWVPPRVFGCESYCDAYDAALEALEKQDPKKPERNFYQHTNTVCLFKHCPRCGEVVNSIPSRKKTVWCYNCGQALKWRYDDEES